MKNMTIKKTIASNKLPEDAFVFTSNGEAVVTDPIPYGEQEENGIAKGPRHHYYEKTDKGFKFVQSFWKTIGARRYNWLICEGKAEHGVKQMKPTKTKPQAVKEITKPTPIKKKKAVAKSKADRSAPKSTAKYKRRATDK